MSTCNILMCIVVFFFLSKTCMEIHFLIYHWIIKIMRIPWAMEVESLVYDDVHGT
jgi:hypothetical protein